MKAAPSQSIGVAIITHKAKHHLPYCLPPLLQSPLKPKILVVNSSSNDGTVELAEKFGAETLVIPRKAFNHGSTRELARRKLATDIVVMATPDAYALDKHVLEILVEPLIQGVVHFSYARQIAHDGADIFESFPRAFNYPSKSQLRSIDDVAKYGVYTFFCSDSFAAYQNAALDQIGGFSSVLTGEDTVATAKLLKQGYRIAYVAEAIVKHSHRYSLWQEFRRNFDTGLAREGYRNLISEGGSDSSRGKVFVAALLKELAKKQPYLIPYALVQSFIKWLGYKAGQKSVSAPLWLKKALSSQDFYWNSDDFLSQ